MGCETVSYQRDYQTRISKTKLLIGKSTHDLPEDQENIKKASLMLNEEDEDMLHRTFAKHFLFFKLSKLERVQLITWFEMFKCQKNKRVFSQGSLGKRFFIIRSGVVSVHVNDQATNQDKKKIKLKRGNYFGDIALIYTQPRSATIMAETDCEFYCIDKKTFRKTTQEIVKKNFQEAISQINKVALFKYLSKKQKTIIAYNSHLLKFQKDSTIFKEGDVANCFYILTSGKVCLEVPCKRYFQMKAFSTFGENCFKPNQFRTGKCKTLEKVTLISIGRESLMKCFGDGLQELYFYSIIRWALNRDKLFQLFSTAQIQQMISKAEIKQCKNGQLLCEIGKRARHIVICLQGKINNKEVGTLYNTQYLISQNEYQEIFVQNLTKVEDGQVAIISFKHIYDIIGKSGIFKLRKEQTTKAELKRLSMQKYQYLSNLKISDFKVRSKLGQGQFGKVYLVEDKFHKLYAMKCVRKNKVIQNKMEKFLIKQRQIMKTVSGCSFMIKLYKTFKDDNYIYFLLNLIDGADFFDVLREIGLCNRETSQFYIGCLILALEQLHNNNIVYRDLKPQNAVIDKKGFLYLIDLGTAKILSQDKGFRTFSIIGTPHYMAPQIVQSEGYSFSVDLWSLGVMLYEIMCGTLPFGVEISDPFEIFKEIEKKQLTFPRFFTDNTSKQLINKLLSKNPNDRHVQDFWKIKAMSFFDEFNWNGLSKKTISTPFKIKPKEQKKNINESLDTFLLKEKIGSPLISQIPNWDADF